MKEGNIFNEQTGEWDINIGDVILFDNQLWIIKNKGKTSLHDHPYINIISYTENWDGYSQKISTRIYSHEAKQIKSYWKIEKIK
jgi:hypothetical protein